MEQPLFHIFLQFIKRGDRAVYAAVHLHDFMMHAWRAEQAGRSIEEVMKYHGVNLGRLECSVSHHELRGIVASTRGGLQQVPTPECLVYHLPSDRAPTVEELRRAWEACTR